MIMNIYKTSQMALQVDRYRHWAYPPPWVVRILKAMGLVVPFTMCVFGMIVLSIHYGDNDKLVKITEDIEDYVQKRGLCRDVQPVSQNSTNVTALRIYNACSMLSSLESQFYSKQDQVINPFNYTYVIPGERICDQETEVITIVHSYHDLYSRRQAIRDTWGQATVNRQWPGKTISQKVKLVFMFGLHRNNTANIQLTKENAKFGDIVQGNFYDSYTNMTLKSLLGLKWVTDHCRNAHYLIKSDDDMFINFPLLLDVLAKEDMTWSIMGPLNQGSRVYRKNSKWSIPKTVFPFYYYPPYESGSAYVISADLVEPMFDTAKYVPAIFIDDVYITGIIGKILRIRHKEHVGFAYWTDKAPKLCQILKNEAIAGTKVAPALQYQLWKGIKAAQGKDTLNC